MRLINSTDFTAEIEFADADVCAEYADESCEWGFSRDKIKEIIGKIPSIDAEPVIRCRECEHWKPTGSKAGNSFSDMEYIGGCEFTKYCRRESDFCSYGKRKEDSADGCL